MPTVIANVEMAAAWDGEEGDDWIRNAERYEATDRFLWERLEADLDVGPGDDVLDVGCGTGASTRHLARRVPEGSVLGIDLSSRMLAYARARSVEAGLTNVTYLRADAQVHPFDPSSADLAVSQFGTMFFGDPVAAFTNIRAALRDGAGLTQLTWQPFARNRWLTEIAGALVGDDLPAPPSGQPGPFGLAEPDMVRRTLAAAGFTAIELVPVDEPVVLGRDADDAYAFVSELGIVAGLAQSLDDDERRAAFDRLRAVLEAHETSDGVLLGSAAWLIRSRAAA